MLQFEVDRNRSDSNLLFNDFCTTRQQEVQNVLQGQSALYLATSGQRIRPLTGPLPHAGSVMDATAACLTLLENPSKSDSTEPIIIPNGVLVDLLGYCVGIELLIPVAQHDPEQTHKYRLSHVFSEELGEVVMGRTNTTVAAQSIADKISGCHAVSIQQSYNVGEEGITRASIHLHDIGPSGMLPKITMVLSKTFGLEQEYLWEVSFDANPWN